MNKMNKTQFDFFKKDGKIYMEELVTSSGLIVLKQMFGDGQFIAVTDKDMENYTYLNEDDVYLETKDMTHEEYSKFMGFVGAYTCPFCGGHLHWEDDFMTSEVRGLNHGYYHVTDPEKIEYLNNKKEEFIKANVMKEVDDIKPENDKINNEGYYDSMVLLCDGEYWEVDDPVIGIYTCGSCGKHYEIQDAYEHEDEDVEYFGESNE